MLLHWNGVICATVLLLYKYHIYNFYFIFLFTLGAFIAGIYGLWNIYVFAILVLYAPSSKATTTHNIELNDDVSHEGTSDTQRFITQPVNAETSLIYSIAGKGSIE